MWICLFWLWINAEADWSSFRLLISPVSGSVCDLHMVIRSLVVVYCFVTTTCSTHGLQHTRLPCPPSPRVCSNSCPLGQWYYLTISSSAHFSSCLQSFPVTGSFPVSQLFTSGSQVLELQLQHQYSSEYSGLISFRIDWFDLLEVQGSLKSLLQHHSSKASVLWFSAFFIVQLWHPYMTTGKTIALTRRTFVSKVMFLLFNMLSRLVITFLPRNEHLLISWLQSPSAVILEPQKIKSVTVSTVSPFICHEVMGPDAMILVFWMSFVFVWWLRISPSDVSWGQGDQLTFVSTLP